MNMVSNINFCARFLKNIPVKKYADPSYTNETASFIEFDLNNVSDVFALDDVSFEFGDDSFVNNIAFDAKNIYKNKGNDFNSVKIYGLTTQTDSFERVKPEKVLGIVETKLSNSEPASREIDFLQVNPKFVYSTGKPEYKRIGSAILDCLKDISRKISLNSSPNATIFYSKNDFVEVSPERRNFVWTKD